MRVAAVHLRQGDVVTNGLLPPSDETYEEGKRQIFDSLIASVEPRFGMSDATSRYVLFVGRGENYRVWNDTRLIDVEARA